MDLVVLGVQLQACGDALADQQRVLRIVGERQVVIGAALQTDLDTARGVGRTHNDHRNAARRPVFFPDGFEERQDVAAGLQHIDDQ